jgi:hypothetical protein
LNIAGQDANGTWHGYYASASIAYFGNNYVQGHATSTDLINWTKDTNNPTLTVGGTSQLDNCTLINGIYYAWSQIVQPGIPYNSIASIPSDVGRLSATSPAGPWSLLPTSTSYRTTAAEGVGTTKGQWADPKMVEALGNVYMYTSIAVDGTTAATQIGCAIATGWTLAQLVKTNEGMLNIPLISDAGLAIQLVSTAVDPFTGADANPIGGNWTQLFTGAAFSPAKLASNFYEGTVAGNNSDSYWNAVSFPNDQWVLFGLDTLADLNCYAGANLRATAGAFASANTYRLYVRGPIGATSKYAITQYVNGVLTALVNETTLPTTSGDVFTASVIGNQVSFYQNGNLINTVVGTGPTSGVAGILATPSVAAGLTGAKISTFSAGGFLSQPSPPSLVYSVPDCRVAPFGPNASRTVQGTTTYDVQTSSNSAVPSKDSRAAGAPVDCRVSPNIPQNSRTPGTYGPGVN